MLKTFASIVAKDARSAIVGAATIWLLTRIPALKEPADRLFWSVIPVGKKVWLISTFLFLVSLVSFWFAFRELVNLGIMQAAERIRAGNPTSQDLEIAHYVIENAKKKNHAV